MTAPAPTATHTEQRAGHTHPESRTYLQKLLSVTCRSGNYELQSFSWKVPKHTASQPRERERVSSYILACVILVLFADSGIAICAKCTGF